MIENNNLLKLLHIQKMLKAPKSQYNDFGKYKYRNCEDILEALKPLLAETDTTLTISDDIVHIVDRYYVKATVTLRAAVDGNIIGNPVSGFAREEETKKGMDGSQITGASSSYARKYALNGLFAIDDTRDSDAVQSPTKAQPNTSVEAPGPLVPGTVETHFLEPLPAPPTTDHSQRVDIGNMLLEMCGSKDEAAAMLEQMTTFTNKEGKVIKGRNSVKSLSDKQVPITFRKVRDQFEKWQAVQQEAPPTADDIPFETEDDY